MTRLLHNKKYKIRWIDIQSFVEWKPKKDILNIPYAIIEAVYIYVGKGKAGLCFASEFNGEEYGNSTLIPKGNIKKITKIK